ncbi:NUDIX hydrolase [Acinetobacter sp.]|uniref:NUDIX hydrolase n=1 Tax=Acinetobacter sp. TaxID=472 RepID=UPI00388DFD6B
MHNTDKTGYEKRPRAGLIPYMVSSDGTIEYLMMVSSDPKFGGPRPMISKGKIEPNEGTLDAAIREAEEELGLKRRNIRKGTVKDLADEYVTLYSGAYHLTLFSCEIIDRYDFDKWCDETEYVTWMTLEDFRDSGRRDHLKYVELLENQLK